jgi:hypothetical protein|tara:strand:- start:24 stop:350 length:327 start_codon:yes stop_codon:yes gene_type:complete
MSELDEALIYLVGVLVVALASALTYVVKQRHGSEDSGMASLQAVVNRMEADVEKLVQAEAEYQAKGWTTLPPDLGSSSALTAVIRDLQHDVSEIKRTLMLQSWSDKFP